MRKSVITLISSTLVLGTLLYAQNEVSSLSAKSDGWEGMAFRIEDSRCFVGIAPVYLSVSELRPEGDNLVGTYTIDVPLKKSKNDTGKIVLPLNTTVKELGDNGGVLKGKAISQEETQKPSEIICEIHPDKDQLILLAITTSERTIHFKSRYEVIQTGKDDG